MINSKKLLEEKLKKIIKEEWDKKLEEMRSDPEILQTRDEDLTDDELDRKIELEKNPPSSSTEPAATVSPSTKKKKVVGPKPKENPVLKIDKDKVDFVKWVQRQFGNYLPKYAKTSTNYNAVFDTLKQDLTGKMPIEKLAQMYLNRQTLKAKFDKQDERDKAREAKAQEELEKDLTRKKNKSGEEKLQAIADKFGLTKERVRQLEAKAIQKLQQKFGIKFIADLKGKMHPDFAGKSSVSDEAEETLDALSAKIDEQINKSAVLFARFIKATGGDANALAKILNDKFNLFGARKKAGEEEDEFANRATYVPSKMEQETIKYLFKILNTGSGISIQGKEEHPEETTNIMANENNALEFVANYLIEDLENSGYQYGQKSDLLDDEGNAKILPHPDDEETTVPMFRIFIDKVVKGDIEDAPEATDQSISEPEESGVVDFFESRNRRRTK